MLILQFLALIFAFCFLPFCFLVRWNVAGVLMILLLVTLHPWLVSLFDSSCSMWFPLGLVSLPIITFG